MKNKKDQVLLKVSFWNRGKLKNEEYIFDSFDEGFKFARKLTGYVKIYNMNGGLIISNDPGDSILLTGDRKNKHHMYNHWHHGHEHDHHHETYA